MITCLIIYNTRIMIISILGDNLPYTGKTAIKLFLNTFVLVIMSIISLAK